MQGAGNTLGGDGKVSASVGATAAGGGGGGGAAAAAKPAVSKIIITRYKNGFTLDEGDGEGDVRTPDKPENAMFLQDLEKVSGHSPCGKCGLCSNRMALITSGCG